MLFSKNTVLQIVTYAYKSTTNVHLERNACDKPHRLENLLRWINKPKIVQMEFSCFEISQLVWKNSSKNILMPLK